MKNCLYALFDTASMFSRDIEFRNMIEPHMKSEKVRQMKDVLDKFNDRDDIRELQNFILQTETNILVS